MGTDVADSQYGKPLIEEEYDADGVESMNGTLRLRKEALCALKRKGYMGRNDSYTVERLIPGATMVFVLRLARGGRFRAEAPMAPLGSIRMKIWMIPDHKQAPNVAGA